MCAASGKKYPKGVTFQTDTLFRLMGRGDNWRLTWLADDSIIASMCDGNWLEAEDDGFHNHLYRILGGPDNFEREDIPNYPRFSGEEGSWFGYGVVSVDGVIWAQAAKTPLPHWSGPFTGVKLLKSDDNGNTWSRVDRNGNERPLAALDDARNLVNAEEMFFLKEYGVAHQQQEAYPFSFFDFVQCGQDNSAAKDDFLYIYSPEGAHAHRVMLARVHKDLLGVRDQWEYFTGRNNGQLCWSPNIEDRQPLHVFPEANPDGNCFGWYSWLPSVVWNEGLGLYIMVNGGTYAGAGMTSSDEDYYNPRMHTKSGSLGLWWAEHPHGPWHEFYYTDHWTADDPANLTYQPTLSPKWISNDGKEMALLWSDAMRNEEGKSHSVNYLWNQMRIAIEL